MRRSKGRERPGFTHISDVTSLLNIGERSARLLIISGQLPGFRDQHGWWASTADVLRLKTYEGVEVSAESACRIAGAAMVVAKQAQNQLTELLNLLGFETGGVPATEEEAKLWLLEISTTEPANIVQQPSEVRRHAKVLLAVTQEFLAWLVFLTEDKNVWSRVRLWAGNLVKHCDALGDVHEDLRRAHVLLRSAERVTRTACYFHLCVTQGEDYAAMFFPEAVGRIDEELVSIILDQQQNDKKVVG